MMMNRRPPVIAIVVLATVSLRKEDCGRAVMNGQTVFVRTLVLAAVFTLGLLTVVRAQTAGNDNFVVTLNGARIFEDGFAAGLTPTEGAGTVVRSGTHASANLSSGHLVAGTVTTTGLAGRLGTAPARLRPDDVISMAVDDCVSGVSVNCGSVLGPPCRACLLPGGTRLDGLPAE
jgi:hypothetical protein